MRGTVLSLLLFLSCVSARRGSSGGGGGGGSGGGVDINLDLSPVYGTAFGFNIVWAIFTLVQVAQACKVLKLSNLYRAPFIILLTAFLFLVTSYSMRAAYIASDLTEHLAFNRLDDAFYVVFDFIAQFGDVLVGAAVLLFLDRLWVDSAQRTNGGGPPIWKRAVDGALLGLTTIFIIAFEGMYGTLRNELNESLYASWKNMSHVIVAFYNLYTIDILATGIMLYMRSSRAGDKSNYAIKQCAFVVAPILLTRSIFFIITEIIYFLPLSTTAGVQFDVFYLTVSIINGLLYFIAFAIFLRLAASSRSTTPLVPPTDFTTSNYPVTTYPAQQYPVQQYPAQPYPQMQSYPSQNYPVQQGYPVQNGGYPMQQQYPVQGSPVMTPYQPQPHTPPGYINSSISYSNATTPGYGSRELSSPAQSDQKPLVQDTH